MTTTKISQIILYIKEKLHMKIITKYIGKSDKNTFV